MSDAWKLTLNRAARCVGASALALISLALPAIAQQEELLQLDDYLAPPPPPPPPQPAYQPPVYQPPVYQPPVQPAYQPPVYQPPAAPAIVPPAPPTQIAYDMHFPGTLGQGDGYEGGYYKELYEFEGEAGEPIIVNLIGSNDERMQLDPFIQLFGPDGEIVAEDDNSGRDSERGDARIQTELPATGTYQILVTTANAYDRGRYTIGLILDN